MPRPGPRRVHLAVRVLESARDRYLAGARRTNVDLAIHLRRMLTYAERNMPDDWTEEDA